VKRRLRAGITWTGVLVLILGLVVFGVGYGYTGVDTEWAGGILSVLGLIVGVAGAAMKPKVKA
jgi:hypothetical protein